MILQLRQSFRSQRGKLATRFSSAYRRRRTSFGSIKECARATMIVFVNDERTAAAKWRFMVFLNIDAAKIMHSTATVAAAAASFRRPPRRLAHNTCGHRYCRHRHAHRRRYHRAPRAHIPAASAASRLFTRVWQPATNCAHARARKNLASSQQSLLVSLCRTREIRNEICWFANVERSAQKCAHCECCRRKF